MSQCCRHSKGPGPTPSPAETSLHQVTWRQLCLCCKQVLCCLLAWPVLLRLRKHVSYLGKYPCTFVFHCEYVSKCLPETSLSASCWNCVFNDSFRNSLLLKPVATVHSQTLQALFCEECKKQNPIYAAVSGGKCVTSCNLLLLVRKLTTSRFVVVLVTISYPEENLLCMTRLCTVSDSAFS